MSQLAVIARITDSEDETLHLAADLARALRPGDVLALHGDLGAGKTRFVRGLAQGLGIDPELVSSPTYVLLHEYEHAGARLLHVDAYRLHAGDEAESLGLDALAPSGAILAVEWAERIESTLPPAGDPRRLDVTIEHAGESRRRITIRADAARLEEAFPGSIARAQRRCPTCGGGVRDDGPSFPFCSPRCRDADLGGWFTERYRISRELKDADLDEG